MKFPINIKNKRIKKDDSINNFKKIFKISDEIRICIRNMI